MLNEKLLLHQKFHILERNLTQLKKTHSGKFTLIFFYFWVIKIFRKCEKHTIAAFSYFFSNFVIVAVCLFAWWCVMRVRALTILALQNILYLISFDSLGSGFNVFSSDHGGFFPGVWNSSTSHPVPKRRSFLVHGISGLLQTILSGPWRTLFGCSRYK